MLHASSLDLSVTLNALGKTGPPTAPVFVPKPRSRHRHQSRQCHTDLVGSESGPDPRSERLARGGR